MFTHPTLLPKTEGVRQILVIDYLGMSLFFPSLGSLSLLSILVFLLIFKSYFLEYVKMNFQK